MSNFGCAFCGDIALAITIFGAHIWTWRHSDAWGTGTLENPIKLAHLVVLTAQLLTQNQNFQNISADTPLKTKHTFGQKKALGSYLNF